MPRPHPSGDKPDSARLTRGTRSRHGRHMRLNIVSTIAKQSPTWPTTSSTNVQHQRLISPPIISRNPPHKRHPVQPPRHRRGRRRHGAHASVRLRSRCNRHRDIRGLAVNAPSRKRRRRIATRPAYKSCAERYGAAMSKRAGFRIFISAVTPELGSYRREVARVLRRKGLEVRDQDYFIQGPGTLLEKLRDYIESCDAVLLLVGDRCGAVPSAEHAVALGDTPGLRAVPRGDRADLRPPTRSGSTFSPGTSAARPMCSSPLRGLAASALAAEADELRACQQRPTVAWMKRTGQGPRQLQDCARARRACAGPAVPRSRAAEAQQPALSQHRHPVQGPRRLHGRAAPQHCARHRRARVRHRRQGQHGARAGRRRQDAAGGGVRLAARRTTTTRCCSWWRRARRTCGATSRRWPGRWCSISTSRTPRRRRPRSPRRCAGSGTTPAGS